MAAYDKLLPITYVISFKFVDSQPAMRFLVLNSVNRTVYSCAAWHSVGDDSRVVMSLLKNPVMKNHFHDIEKPQLHYIKQEWHPSLIHKDSKAEDITPVMMLYLIMTMMQKGVPPALDQEHLASQAQIRNIHRFCARVIEMGCTDGEQADLEFIINNLRKQTVSYPHPKTNFNFTGPTAVRAGG